jgi:hypothetical protein
MEDVKMRGGMRVAGAVVALGLLGVAAKADTTYSFNLQPGVVLGVGSPFTAMGSFTLNGFGGVTGGSATLGMGGVSYALGTASGLVASSIVNLSFSSAVSNVTLSLQGRVPSSNNTFTGNLSATASTNGGSSSTAETGLFTASVSSGGAGGGSGGAPAPELSGLLGMGLAGGTFAFLRRRRDSRTLKTAA